MGSSPELRASDAEREQVAEALRSHAAEGRLDPDELDHRLGAAYAARTHGDLAVLTPDFWPKWVLLATTVVAILRLGGAHDRRMG
jgi:hypothetical protein